VSGGHDLEAERFDAIVDWVTLAASEAGVPRD